MISTKMNRSKWEEYSRGIFSIEKCQWEGWGTRRFIPSDAHLGKFNDKTVCCDKEELRTRSLIQLSNLSMTDTRKRTKSLSDVACQFSDEVNYKIAGPNPILFENLRVNEAGRRVVNLIMLNAWRRRTEDNNQVRELADRLTKEVSSLNMQVHVLRQLLCNKKMRDMLAAKEMHKNLLKLENYAEEKRLILKKKESLECDVKELQDLITDLQSKCKNLENDLDTAKFEADTWELRLKKERKKLKVVKEENACLRKEARSREHQLDYQSECLQDLNSTIKQLHQELETQRVLLKEAMQQVQSADEKVKITKQMETEKDRMIMEKDQEIKDLKSEIMIMEEKFQAQGEKNGELRKLISEKTRELIMINEKLGEFAKREKFWGKKMRKMASLCTRIPIACFYTVATLVLPQPWYRFL